MTDKTIDDDPRDFAYHMFRAIARLELQNLWMDYDKICAYMKKQEYARNFDEEDIRSYIEMYIEDYNEEMNLFEESEDDSFVIRLRDCVAVSAIRKALHIFDFPRIKTAEINESFKLDCLNNITELKAKISAIDNEWEQLIDQREQLIDQLEEMEYQLTTIEDQPTEPEPEPETGIVLMCKPKRGRPKKVV